MQKYITKIFPYFYVTVEDENGKREDKEIDEQYFLKADCEIKEKYNISGEVLDRDRKEVGYYITQEDFIKYSKKGKSTNTTKQTQRNIKGCMVTFETPEGFLDYFVSLKDGMESNAYLLEMFERETGISPLKVFKRVEHSEVRHMANKEFIKHSKEGLLRDGYNGYKVVIIK